MSKFNLVVTYSIINWKHLLTISVNIPLFVYEIYWIVPLNLFNQFLAFLDFIHIFFYAFPHNVTFYEPNELPLLHSATSSRFYVSC